MGTYALDRWHLPAYIGAHMRRVSLFVSENLLAGLDRLKAEHGTPQAESIRRAIAAYLDQKGVKTAARQAGTKQKRRK
jgi:metal-responsive CopG/Arc/MetJ family transcriptional regulator